MIQKQKQGKTILVTLNQTKIDFIGFHVREILHCLYSGVTVVLL